MHRRDFVRRLAATVAFAGVPNCLPTAIHLAAQDRDATTPSDPSCWEQLPANLRALLQRVLRKAPASFNTDWDGTMAIEALLRWSGRGLPQGTTFAKAWFDHHVDQDPKLTDEQLFATYSGPRSRVIRGRVLPFTLYSGFFGLPFPCHALFEQTADPRARQVCLDVADAILHVTARERHGLVLHDDGVWSEGAASFTIPDTIYFVARALMIASLLDQRISDVYQTQALHQIRTCAGVFLDPDKGLARTVLTPAGLGKTFWCRASGWLAYALAGVLRHLPPTHTDFSEIAASLARLADGVARHQGPAGGLCVLIDQRDTPEETSATAMCVASIKEAVTKGWIVGQYDQFLERGWEFVRKRVADDGTVSGVYTGWAMTAEKGQILIDHTSTERGWIPAVILHAAALMIP